MSGRREDARGDSGWVGVVGRHRGMDSGGYSEDHRQEEAYLQTGTGRVRCAREG